MSDILVIDDDLGTFEAGLRQTLRGHRLHLAYSGGEALKRLEQRPEIDLVLCDIMMPAEFADADGREGIEVLKRIRVQRPELPVIMLTVLTDVDLVVEAMQEGAFHYIAKPIDRDKLRNAVARATENTQLRQRVNTLNRARDALLKVHTGRPKARRQFQGMVGAHPLMQGLYNQIERAAQFDDMNVVILGETGSGKDLVAQAIHRCSPRRNEPFVAVNCASLAESVLDAELFGHEKGAFTGAEARRDGLFVQADGGTLFLDEIGDMAPALQGKLLRAIENKEVRPVGGTPVTVDVRIVCATNRDLTAAKEAKEFREDLYYRIWDIPLTLPPLRDRRDDIPLLTNHFLAEWIAKNHMECTIDPATMDLLTQYDWPGNVRELHAAVRRMAAFAEDGHITPAVAAHALGLDPAQLPMTEEVGQTDRPEAPVDDSPAPPEEPLPRITDLAEYRKVHGEVVLKNTLERAIRQAGNARAAMQLLGMPEDRYTAFRKWLQRLGISVRQLSE